MSLESTPKHREAVNKKIAEIEAEMKRINMWDNTPLPLEKFNFTQAFGMDTMAFSQWIQFILIPRVRQILETKGEFPNGSMVAVQAMREFDGYDEAGKLLSLLREFDELFNQE